jgi:hypothetical protein
MSLAKNKKLPTLNNARFWELHGSFTLNFMDGPSKQKIPPAICHNLSLKQLANEIYQFTQATNLQGL